LELEPGLVFTDAIAYIVLSEESEETGTGTLTIVPHGGGMVIFFKTVGQRNYSVTDNTVERMMPCKVSKLSVCCKVCIFTI
jgi:hypothetical protein